MRIPGGNQGGAYFDPTVAVAGSSAETCLLEAQAALEQSSDEARGVASRARQVERHAAEGRIAAMERAARETFRGSMVASVTGIAGAAGQLVSLGAAASASEGATDDARGEPGGERSALAFLGRGLASTSSVGGLAKSIFDHRASEADVSKARAALEESTAGDARKDAASEADREAERAARQRQLVLQMQEERSNTFRALIRV
ncbi:MAG: hypothetical protein U0230_15175 [Polyangiales bacterium]